MAERIRMAVSETGETADIFVYDNIGESSFFFDAFSAKDMRDAIAETDAPNLNIRINTLGGDPYQAIAMHSLLKDSGRTVTTTVDGIAASAGSIIAMAGETVEMKAGSMMMIHHPAMFADGTAVDLRRAAAALDKISESAIDIYEAKSGKSRQSITKMMDDETWMTASEAKTEGFADSVSTTEAVAMSASKPMLAAAQKQFRNIPETPLLSVTEPAASTETSTPEVKVSKKPEPVAPEAPAQTVTMTVEQYEQMKSQPTPQTEVDSAVEAERIRVAEIHSVGQLAGMDAAQIKEYVDNGTPLVEVQRAAIATMQTKNPPASDGDGDQTTDEDLAYRKEYRDALNSGVQMSGTENEYVNVRRVEDGKARKQFETKDGE